MSLELLPINPDPTILAGSVIGGDQSAVFEAALTLYSEAGKACRTVTGLVDTRFRYSVVPATILRELGIVPQGKHPCSFSCGHLSELPSARPLVSLNGKSGRQVILFGESDRQIYIGLSTLSGLALAADPENKGFVNVLLHL